MLMPPIALALLIAGPAPVPAPQTWEVEGVTREAIVQVPSRPVEGRVALVFDFHGHGGSAAHSVRAHRLHEAWPEAVVVSMQGLKTPGTLSDPEGKRTGWQSAPGDQGDRDLKFFDAVLASIKAEYPVDPRRVFATGHSNGGGFTYLLWATRSQAIAACAVVSAAPKAYFIGASSKPLLHVVGTHDPLVSPALQLRILERIKARNGCESQPQVWAPGAEWFASSKGTPIVVFTHDGGHEYPKEAPGLIARFFREYAPKD